MHVPSVAVLAALAAVSVGCGLSGGGGGGGSSDPCGECPAGGAGTSRCFTEVRAPGGAPVPVACVQTCAAGACGAGSACVDLGGERVCSPFCETSACPGRTQCAEERGLHASCIAVRGECSDRVGCEDVTKVCDPAALACYPANGACTSDAGCPRFDRAFGGPVLACVQGFCRIAPAPPRQVTALRTAAEVPVLRPTPGEAFASAEALVLRWDAAGDASIALVLRDAPAETAAARDVTGLAAWAAGLGPGEVVEVEPALAGHPVVDGKVQAGIGLDPAASGPLYLLVQAVREGALLRASALVPFRIGGSWPVDGTACTAGTTIPGACASPAAALACVDGACRTLCAAHLDCAASGRVCGDTRRLAGTSGAGTIWYRACEGT